MLRTIAKDLRTQGAKQAEVRQAKAASVLIAATGFGLLRSKLGGVRG
jgi:hypothetical protein